MKFRQQLNRVVLISSLVACQAAQAGLLDLMTPGTGGGSYRPVISADGRVVAFDSYDPGLAPNDANGANDVFLLDTQSGNVMHFGGNDGASTDPSLSADGKILAFDSDASQLVADDYNGQGDIFVYDGSTLKNITIRGNGPSFAPQLSGDGRYVVFITRADNLVAGDRNGDYDLLLYDRQLDTFAFVADPTDTAFDTESSSSISRDGSVIVYEARSNNPNATDFTHIYLRDMSGASTCITCQANGDSHDPQVSGNGQFVVFFSSANNLVPGDNNDFDDIFLYDRNSGAISLISIDSAGMQALAHSWGATISDDSNTVAFFSDDPDIANPSGSDGAALYVLDLSTHHMQRVASLDRDEFPTTLARLTGDGQQVVFDPVERLTPDDTNSVSDIYMYDQGVDAASASDFQVGNPPENAIDGKLSTWWSARGDGQWLQLNYLRSRKVSGVGIAWLDGNKYKAAFDILVSLDGQQWATVFSGSSSGESTAIEVTTFSPVDAKYVRLVGHGNQVNDWNSVSEFRVESPMIVATASSFQTGHPPQNTLDGDLSTRWSARGAGQWIQYDLGYVREVNVVYLAWLDSETRQETFKIETSLDGERWEAVFNGVNSGNNGLVDYPVTPTQARYVRITGYGNTVNDWNSLNEAGF